MSNGLAEKQNIWKTVFKSACWCAWQLQVYDIQKIAWKLLIYQLLNPLRTFRSINTGCWIRFLNLHDFKKVNKRVINSHFLCKIREGIRGILVRENDKDGPDSQLSTGCKTIGYTMEELYQWVEENCQPWINKNTSASENLQAHTGLKASLF